MVIRFIWSENTVGLRYYFTANKEYTQNSVLSLVRILVKLRNNLNIKFLTPPDSQRTAKKKTSLLVNVHVFIITSVCNLYLGYIPSPAGGFCPTD